MNTALWAQGMWEVAHAVLPLLPVELAPEVDAFVMDIMPRTQPCPTCRRSLPGFVKEQLTAMDLASVAAVHAAERTKEFMYALHNRVSTKLDAQAVMCHADALAQRVAAAWAGAGHGTAMEAPILAAMLRQAWTEDPHLAAGRRLTLAQIHKRQAVLLHDEPRLSLHALWRFLRAAAYEMDAARVAAFPALVAVLARFLDAAAAQLAVPHLARTIHELRTLAAYLLQEESGRRVLTAVEAASVPLQDRGHALARLVVHAELCSRGLGADEKAHDEAWATLEVMRAASCTGVTCR